jgi:predicted nucleic acid-binding Zn ribbon protein
MPIREYRCIECGYTIERLELNPNMVAPFHWHETETHATPIAMQPIISVPAQPQFKGSGFYSTDYKKIS